MRWQLKKVNSHVDIHLLLAVDVQIFIWVDWHQESPNVGLQIKTRKGRCAAVGTFDNTEDCLSQKIYGILQWLQQCCVYASYHW